MSGLYLDLGCGKGYASLMFKDCFSEIINLDVNKKKTKLCKQNCCENGVKGHFITADASKLPFRKSCINVISAFSLIEHIQNQSVFIKEINQVLQKGGILLMQFPNANSFIEAHTGMLLPTLCGKRLFNLYCKHILRIQKNVNIQNLTKTKATELCKNSFGPIYIGKCNYCEEILMPKIKGLYRLFRKLKILELFPLSWIFVCIKKPRSLPPLKV